MKLEKLPKKLKDKLQKLQEICCLAHTTTLEVGVIIESYKIDIEYLDGMISDSDKPSTEALTCIVNAEGNVNDNIRDIEKVFLWHYNNKIGGYDGN